MIEDVRRVSQGLTKSPYRLEIGAAVCRSANAAMTIAEVIALLDEAYPIENEATNVTRNLDAFRRAGLLQHPTDGLWNRVSSPFWPTWRKLYDDLLAVGSTRSQSTRRT